MYSYQENENFILMVNRVEIKKLRIMLVSAIFSYPLWWLLGRFIAPQAYDPLWQRLLLSLISACLLGISFVRKDFNTRKFYYIGWLYSYHLLFLYWKNSDVAFYLISNLIQFPYLILSFPDKKDASIYTFTKFAVAIVFALFVPYKIINPWLYTLGIITIGYYSLTSLSVQFKILDNLKAAQKEFDLALSNMLEGIIITNLEGKILAYNKISEKFLNFHKNSHIGKKLEDTILFTNCVFERDSSFSKSNHPILKAYSIQRPSHNIVLGIDDSDSKKTWLQFNIQPLIGAEAENKILLSFSDITTFKEEQDLREIQHAQLAMNAKLSAMFAVASGVAHEINNPLGIISGRVQLLLKKLESESYTKDEITNTILKINDSSNRISRIVSNLLTLSKRADEFPLATAKLSQIIGDTLLIYRENLKNNEIDLIVDEIPEVNIKCRAIQISQVMYNLLNNASDAVMSQTKKWIHISFQTNHEFVTVTICDSGPEISKEIKDRMMEPFFTTKEIGKGTGLGLSVSKAIIEEHGGRIFLDQTTKNTCIKIQLRAEKN